MATCRHKFVHLRTESWYDAYRYANHYYLVDLYFCEKCLEEKKVSKDEYVSIYKETPDWAISIKHKRKSE